MCVWSGFDAAAPELAAAVRGRLEAHKHLTIATLRRDGSPRISGTEVVFEDGELYIGSGEEALKARDLRRDGRYALHSGSDDPDGWQGDAKVAGVATAVPADGYVRFRLAVSEASTVKLNAERNALVITVWTPDEGVQELIRE